MVENCVTEPVNLGSGTGVSIKDVEESIRDCYDKEVNIEGDITKPKGDALRLMDTSRAEKHGFRCTTPLLEGIKETTDWFLKNRDLYKKRNNYFRKEDG